MAEPFLKIGERLTDYVNVDVTVQCLTFGGFGVVAVCRDETQPERPVVMKTLLPHLMRQAETRRMFVREALIWKGVRKHANILPLLSVTKIAGRPYLKLLYADEGSLRDHLRAGVPSMVQAITWAQHIAAGLAHLHAPDPERLRPDPLVHRDLKPENVLIASGRVRNRFAVISDFGLAKAVESSAATSVGTMGLGSAHEPDSTGVRETSSQLVHTQRGRVVGTVAYMAPEQWEDSASASTHADVYAFGLILSELFAGRHALLDWNGGQLAGDWREVHLHATPRSLRTATHDVPDALEELYMACLAKRPQNRPTAHEALDTLRAVAPLLGGAPYEPPALDHVGEDERAYWNNWSNAYANFGFHEEALLRNERALAIDRHPTTLMNRGTILFSLKRYAEAEAAYREALASWPAEDREGRFPAYTQLGILLGQIGRYREAEGTFSQALEGAPEWAPIWHNRAQNELLWGRAEAKAGHRTVARRHFKRARGFAERALELDSKLTITRRLLDRILDSLEAAENQLTTDET